MLHRRTRTALTLALVATVALAACGDDDPGVGEGEGDGAIELTPLPTDEPSVDPAQNPTPFSPTPTPSPSDEPSPDASPREATDTDRARFVAGYRPDGASDLEHVAVDITGDEVEELVFAYVANGTTARVDVAYWQGTAYEVSYRAEGGPAARIERLRVNDINADGIVEIATFQTNGGGSSITLWQVSGEQSLTGLRAQGGCADGLNTYGVVGAELEDRDGDGAAEVYASCDDSPLPVAAWSTHTYVWQDGAYRFDGEL